MTATLLSAAHRSGGAVAWLGRTVLWTYLTGVVVTCTLLIVYGPQLRAALEAERASAVDAETFFQESDTSARIA